MRKKSAIVCRNSRHGELDFYLITPTDEYWLFTNSFKRNLKQYFKNEVEISAALDMSTTRDPLIHRFKEKLPKYIRYIEMNEGIVVLDKTAKKKGDNRYGKYTEDKYCA